MVDGFRPHELLSSDEYWQTERLNIPILPLGYLLLEGFSGGLHIFAQPTISKVRALHRLASQSGYIPEEILFGEQLPILPRGEGLLRVIRDYKRSTPPKHLTKSERTQTDKDEFDELAEEILANRLYQGRSAKLTILETDQPIKISRTASYLTGSRTGRILEGIGSEYISGRNDLEDTEISYPVFVGETYATGINKDGLFKVVKAEILVLGSSSKIKVMRSKPKLKLASVTT